MVAIFQEIHCPRSCTVLKWRHQIRKIILAPPQPERLIFKFLWFQPKPGFFFLITEPNWWSCFLLIYVSASKLTDFSCLSFPPKFFFVSVNKCSPDDESHYQHSYFKGYYDPLWWLVSFAFHLSLFWLLYLIYFGKNWNYNLQIQASRNVT
jgi:hypothetical protein